MRRFQLPLALLLATSACQVPFLGSRTPVYYEIGVVHRAISTDSSEAQLWFDRGLALNFGFNHEEALACYARAAEADPDCAMIDWGIAYAHGTNYNAPSMSPAASEAAWEALQRALGKLEGASPVERDLIHALEARYAWPAPEDRGELELAYADAMRSVSAAHPDDADVQALLAEALMQLKPWALWSPEGEPADELHEIRAVIEAGLERWPSHPALCHLYIHAMEAGPDVAQALPAAQRLEELTPGLGHLVHMPSHIYAWTGDYADVVRVNVEAVALDDAYVEHAGRANTYTGYRIHNYHFVAYGGMWDGQRDLALEYARRIADELPPAMVANAADTFEAFLATPYHVMVRFGMWDAILDEPEPAPEHLATRAVWRYARGVALASLGRVEEARAEQTAFLAAKEAVPASRRLFGNSMADILGVGEAVLAGELAYRAGEKERGFEHLREAVRLDELLNYDEPWGWMEPARHALGALLTADGRYREALEVYAANLERYPENGWALRGTAECQRALGWNEYADITEQAFARVWERADVEIPGSCYCRVDP